MDRYRNDREGWGRDRWDFDRDRAYRFENRDDVRRDRDDYRSFDRGLDRGPSYGRPYDNEEATRYNDRYARDRYERDRDDRDRYDARYAWERSREFAPRDDYRSRDDYRARDDYRSRDDYRGREYDPRSYSARSDVDRDRLLGRDFEHDRWAGRRERYDRDDSRDDLERGRHYFDDYPWSKPRW